MCFLFRLDLSLHAGAEFFFGILNFGTKHGPGFVFLFLHKNQPKMVFTLHVCYFFLNIKDTFTSVGRHHLTGLPNISKKC